MLNYIKYLLTEVCDIVRDIPHFLIINDNDLKKNFNVPNNSSK